MKSQNLLNLFLAIIFLCLTNLSIAQSEIYGTWTAKCALEKTSISSMCTCGICPTVRVDSSSISFQNIDMTITDKTIKLGDSEPVVYKWDKNIDGITFQYKKGEEFFKILGSAVENLMIWKEPKSGCILILQKK